MITRVGNEMVVIMMFVRYDGQKGTKGRLEALNNHNTEKNENV